MKVKDGNCNECDPNSLPERLSHGAYYRRPDGSIWQAYDWSGHPKKPETIRWSLKPYGYECVNEEKLVPPEWTIADEEEL